jgi:hypothetical protein
LSKCSFVQVVEFAANGKSVGQLAQANRKSFQSFGKVMGGCLTLERRIHGENDFVYAGTCDAPDELVDAEILRSNALESREPATEHVIATRKQARPIERPKIGDVLDDAQHFLVTPRVAADAAWIRCIDVAADRAGGELVSDVL